MNYRTVS